MGSIVSPQNSSAAALALYLRRGAIGTGLYKGN